MDIYEFENHSNDFTSNDDFSELHDLFPLNYTSQLSNNSDFLFNDEIENNENINNAGENLDVPVALQHSSHELQKFEDENELLSLQYNDNLW